VERDRLGALLGGSARSVAAMVLGVGAGPSRRVRANGFSPGLRARQIMPKRPADPARMGTRLQLDAIASGSIRLQNATSKFRCQSLRGRRIRARQRKSIDRSVLTI